MFDKVRLSLRAVGQIVGSHGLYFILSSSILRLIKTSLFFVFFFHMYLHYEYKENMLSEICSKKIHKLTHGRLSFNILK